MKVLAFPGTRVRNTATTGVRPLPAQERWAARAGYWLPLLAIATAVLTWFRPGRFIAAGDVAPYVRENLAGELSSIWNHQTSGGGSTTYAITEALDVLLLRLTGLVGLSPVVAQYLLYAGCFGFAAFGGGYLAGVWTYRPAARAVAALCAGFNIFLLVNHPNVLPAIAIGLTGVLTGMFLRAGAGRATSAWAIALVTLPSSYLAQNPPLLVVAAGTVVMAIGAADLLVGPGASWRALRLLLRSAPLIVLGNAWWAAPYALTLIHGEGLSVSAQTDIGTWAWTQTRASLPNVAALNAHWGWAHVEYFPFRPGMEAPPWPVLRWALPVLALLGVLLADRSRRRAAYLIAALCLPLIWLGKGVHPPYPWVNMWLYDHVPGLWLFRDPANKVTVVLVLAYTTLTAIAIDRLATLAAACVSRLARVSARCVVVGLAGMAITYPWPLWTGAVVGYPGAISEGGRIPSAWYRVAAAVNAAPDRGKALILPLDPYYQVSTNWGYHGVDAVPAQLIRRPVLRQLPGGYFASPVNGSLTALESALLSGADQTTLARMLRSLGVSHIIVRHDLVADPDLPAHADAKTISAALNRLVGDRQVARYKIADLYHVPFVTGPINAYRWLATADRAENADLPRLPPDAAFTDSVHAGTDVASRRLVASTGFSHFSLSDAGRYRLTHETERELPLRVGLQHGPRGATLTLQDANRIAVDGHDLPARRPVRLATFADRGSAALDVNGRLRPVPKDGSLVTPEIGTTVAVYGREQNAIAGGFGPLNDCDRSDRRTPEQAGLSRETPEPGWIRLRAVAHSACVSMPVHAGAPAYRVRFSYRSPTGHLIRFCLWQPGPNLCAGLPAAPPSRSWRTYDRWAHIAPGIHKLFLYLYADGPGKREAAVEYRDVQVDQAQVIAATRVMGTGPPPVTRSLTAGRHTITMSPQPPPVRLGEFSSLQDCNARIGPEALHSMSVRHTGPQSVQLAAAADTACVMAPVPGPVAGDYRITLDYRTLSGLQARICVWQVGPGTCAPLPDLAISRDWRTLSATFHPERRTRRLQIFLYADGQAQPRTITEYRDIALTVVSPETVTVADAAQPAPAPHLKVHSEGLARYDVDVRGAGGTFVLTLAESYADGWHLEGLPYGRLARHLPVDGYANGWVVTGQGDAHIRLVYTPEDWMRPALSLYGLTLLCILGSLIGLYRRIWRPYSRGFGLGLKRYFKSLRKMAWRSRGSA